MKIKMLKEKWLVRTLFVENCWLHEHGRKNITQPLYRANTRHQEYWRIL